MLLVWLSIVVITVIMLMIVCRNKNETFMPLVGQNKCTWGPNYWCNNEENAKECGVTWEECQKYITKPPPSQIQVE